MCVQCMYRGPILKSPAKRGPGSGVYVYEKLYFGLGGGGSNMQVVDTSGMACAMVEQKEVDRGVGLEKHGTLCGAVKWYGGGCGAGA